MIVMDDAISNQVQPAMLEEGQNHRAVRPSVIQRSAQGVKVVKIPPEWTWQCEPVKQLIECLSLKENWNSYGSRPLSEDSVFFAIDFLSAIPHVNPPRPSVVPLPSGRVQLEWRKGERELDIEFWPDGSIEFLKEGPEGEEKKIPAFTTGHAQSLIAWLLAV